MTDFEKLVCEMVSLLPDTQPSTAKWMIGQEPFAKRWRQISGAYGSVSAMIINAALDRKYYAKESNNETIRD